MDVDDEYEEIEEEIEEEEEEEEQTGEEFEFEEDESEDEAVEEAGAEDDEELVSSNAIDSRKDIAEVCKEAASVAEVEEELTLVNGSSVKNQETDKEVKAEVGTENAVRLTQVIEEDNVKEELDRKGPAAIAQGLTAFEKIDHGKVQGMNEYAAAEVVEEQAPAIINDHKEENGQVVDPAWLDKGLGSNSATLQEPVAILSLDFSVVRNNHDNYRNSSPNLANEGNQSAVHGNKPHSDDNSISLHKGGVPEKAFGCETSAENAEIFGIDGASKGTIGAQYCKDLSDREAAQAQDVEDMDISPRSDVPHSRPRSSPPGSQSNEKNKRQAIICDFFSKGWCIKGNSCRFLHVRDNAASSPKEGGVDAKLKGTLEGLKDTTPILAKNMPSDPALSCVEREATLRSKSGEELPVEKSDPLSITSLKDNDKGMEYFEPKPYLANHSCSSLSVPKDCSQTYGNISFDKGLPSKNYRNAGVPTYLSHLEGIRTKEIQSLHAVPPGLQKPVEGGKERSVSGSVVSLQHRSPPISCSESELISHVDVSAFTQQSSLCKPKPFIDNWERSIPFRPSFLITRRMLSGASLYDPIRDSIEQTKAQDKPSQSPMSGQDTSVSGTHACENADPIVTGGLFPDQSSNKQSVSSHSSHKDTVRRKLSEKENELNDTAGSPHENVRTSSKGKQLLKSTDFRGNTETDKAHYGNHTMQKNGLKRKMEVKAEKAKGRNNVDVLVLQESKAGKQFQAALVEFIKDLLKPTWHLGFVSRDAYKIIVKKTADKVMGALNPQQIPDTSESVKEYLSCAQPKLEKLVNGYVDKYGHL
ncbi:unnamed protein product [Cuscuta epithymum]|uniref:C3H1-type domain-containing protein n=1 Tax=Cuscuta epithymum TaxID=186058 RepID=A0AAV0G268_9ASTE|nr:unnamed protein product [Cuscuta epithymum]